jgi:hypothetical protein
MSKIIFATGVTKDVVSKEILSVDYATVERISNAGFNGVKITNRSGDEMFLDIDAAAQLAFVLKDLVK